MGDSGSTQSFALEERHSILHGKELTLRDIQACIGRVYLRDTEKALLLPYFLYHFSRDAMSNFSGPHFLN